MKVRARPKTPDLWEKLLSSTCLCIICWRFTWGVLQLDPFGVLLLPQVWEGKRKRRTQRWLRKRKVGQVSYWTPQRIPSQRIRPHAFEEIQLSIPQFSYGHQPVASTFDIFRLFISDIRNSVSLRLYFRIEIIRFYLLAWPFQHKDGKQ